MMSTEAEPIFFATPEEMRAWLERHHETEREAWIGFHKKGSGRPSITWPESVDEALCFGWIDGVRKSIDENSYVIRFTPRKPRSNWSTVNVARVEALTREGRMRPAGLRAWEQRAEEKTGIYSYEQRKEAALDEEMEREFRADAAAWEFFQSLAPGYRQTSIFFVMSAKKEETRRKRLATLIEASRNRNNIAILPTRKPK